MPKATVAQLQCEGADVNDGAEGDRESWEVCEKSANLTEEESEQLVLLLWNMPGWLIQNITWGQSGTPRSPA